MDLSDEAPATLEDVFAAARTVALRSAAGEAAERAAWLLRNRALAARAARRATGRPHPEFGDGTLAGAARAAATAAAAPIDAAAVWRAAAAVCLMLSGDRPDPTGGAIR